MARAPFIKHVGRHAGTGQRLSVVFMSLPDEPDSALAVYSDTLPDRYHDSYMEAIESNEGQSTNNLYEVLSRKVFWHGKVMLDTLHSEGHLSKIPTNQIIMTPNTQTNVPLNEINDAMNSTEDTTVETVEPQESRIDSNVKLSKDDENKQIAWNLLVQANLLAAEAEAKRQEAYKYDASLIPKTKKAAKPKAKAAVDTSAIPDVPKKRGRPRKSVT
jgi:hypothetical protein